MWCRGNTLHLHMIEIITMLLESHSEYKGYFPPLRAGKEGNISKYLCSGCPIIGDYLEFKPGLIHP